MSSRFADERVSIDGAPLPPNGMYSKVVGVEDEEIQANLRRIKDSGESDLTLLPFNKNGHQGVVVRSTDSELHVGFLPTTTDKVQRLGEGVCKLQLRNLDIRAKVVMLIGSSPLGMNIYLYDNEGTFIRRAIDEILRISDGW